MTIVIDIECPSCGSIEAVRKLAIDRYRCDNCTHEFSPDDVLSD